MLSQALVALSLFVAPAASIEHKFFVPGETITVHLYGGHGGGCSSHLDTTYTGTDLMTGTSCQKVMSHSAEKGQNVMGLRYLGDQKASLKFKVHDTCANTSGMAVVMEASEAESAKILNGECGEITSYLGDDLGYEHFHNQMYMKITPVEEAEIPTTSAAPVPTTAAPVTLTESTHMDPNTIQLFDAKEHKGCFELDTTYTSPELMTDSSCKTVVSDQADQNERTIGFKYMQGQKTLEFQVYESCDTNHVEDVGIVASEVESKKILAGQCGEVSLYVGVDKTFFCKMYMKISPDLLGSSAADGTASPTLDAEQTAVADQAERTNMVMPVVSVVLAWMLLAY